MIPTIRQVRDRIQQAQQLHCWGEKYHAMTQAQIDKALDREINLGCHSSARAWLHHQRDLGRKAVLTPNNCWYAELLDQDGNFYAMLAPHEYDYFVSL